MNEVSLDEITEQRPRVRGFVLRLVGDEALAEDLTQETFLRAQRRVGTYRGEAVVASWLSAIALNLVRDHYRAQTRIPDAVADDQAIDEVPFDGNDAEQALLQAEMSACIGEFLARLPRSQYEVVALHDMAGLKHREVAALLDLTTANTRVLLHRSRTALRRIMEDNCLLSFGDDSVPCERRPPPEDD